tara:strand:- start:983 stop:1156 length:174 start_codon:yes stop_codon:yes gene_type:complete
LGFSSPIDKKIKRLQSLQNKAFEAQRNGNLRLAGKYLLEAEVLEKEILQAQNQKGEQ